MNSRHSISIDIKAEALRLGFDACGITRIQPVQEQVQKFYREWLAEGKNGNMDYLANYEDKRFNPSLLVDGTKSIVCVALNYYPTQLLNADTYQLAWYAYGKDYHLVVKEKLQQLLAFLQKKYPALEGRAFVDTAPILEKYWAQQAGLGWIGRHTQLIIPQRGSTFFLGEILLNAELEYDEPYQGQCGNCNLCQKACPMQALSTHSETGAPVLNARKCLSYLTIENREAIPPEAQKKMGRTIYGCDRCQQVCPHNRKTIPSQTAEFQPKEALVAMQPSDWQQLTLEQYQQIFQKSAVKRVKYTGLMRNIQAVATANAYSSNEQDTILPESQQSQR